MLPPRAFYSLPELCARWRCMPFDVAGWSAEGLLAVLAAIPEIATEDGEALAGVVDVNGADLLPLFLRDEDGAARILKRVRRNGGNVRITQPAEGVPVTVSGILVRGSEVARFERAHDLGVQVRGRPRVWSGRTGRPPRHDWESFYGAVVRRVHDRGLPATREELVRDMLEWFADRRGSVPDESTIRRKLLPVWRELRGVVADGERFPARPRLVGG